MKEYVNRLVKTCNFQLRLVYKSLHKLAPAYKALSCVKKSNIQRRSGLRLASGDDLVIPTTKTKFE